MKGFKFMGMTSGPPHEQSMMADLDYAEMFAETPSPYLVLRPDLVILEVNRAYLKATGRTREDLIGQHLFDAFPDNPDDPDADGVQNLSASLQRVLNLRKQDTMALQKYDIPIMGRPGAFEERWWSPVNTPILNPDGTVKCIIHRVEDVTAYIKAHSSEHRSSIAREALEAELYSRARELQRLNEELRLAHKREREVALTLQEAMLQSPDLARHDNIAVRYLPATGMLNVCGDWYDMVDLNNGRFSVAVGDVVGHGLEAAAVMGMLRGALSAAMRALGRPAQALELLSLYSRTIDGALNTTVVKMLVDPHSHTLIYSSAGHPPPILAHPDGSCDLLNQAVEPPLGARPEDLPFPQASRVYVPGDTLVLYSDGLIERRDEDIDVGIARLSAAVRSHCTDPPEPLADALLSDLGVEGGARDDIALLIVRL
jgi:serine phosphatase RsbU (regulator of sigma subunit)